MNTPVTHVSRALRIRDPERALVAAGETVPDWSGGTRLGETLRFFLDRWGQRGMARGAVVVIFSDGWERGDPALVGREMERLARLAHRVVWVNPRVSATAMTTTTNSSAQMMAITASTVLAGSTAFTSV